MPKPKESLPWRNLIFAGDRDDPIFRSTISTVNQDHSDERIVNWPEGGSPPDRLHRVIATQTMDYRLVIHRKSMGPREITVLSQIRESIASTSMKPTIELIVGDLVRYADLQIAATLVDKVVPESIAFEVYRLRESKPIQFQGDVRSDPIGILSANDALADTLQEIVREWGYAPTRLGGWSDPSIPSSAFLIWDVPALSERWETRLRDQSKVRPILTLLGFADKTTVDRARSAGAVACLGLPFEIEHLRTILERYVVEIDSTKVPEVTHRKGPSTQREIGDPTRNLRKDTGHPMHTSLDSHLHRTAPTSVTEPTGIGRPLKPNSD